MTEEAQATNETTQESTQTTNEGTTQTANENTTESSNESLFIKEKPEYISDRIWKENFEGKEVSAEDVAKYYANAYANAEKYIKTRKEQVAEDVKNEMLANRPEKPIDYTYEIEVDGEKVNPLDNDDPVLIKFKTIAHEKGLSQDEFVELMDLHMEAVASTMPDFEKEKERIGENAEERISYVNSWLAKTLPAELFAEVAKTPVTAQLLEVFEGLMEATGNVTFSKGSGKPAGSPISMEEIIKLQSSDEYMNGDPATVEKVKNAYKKLFG